MNDTTPKLGVLLRIESAIPTKKYGHYAQYCRSSQKGQSGGRGGTLRKGNKKQGHGCPKPTQTVNQVNKELRP